MIGDWPWWRGPTRNGIAEPDQKPPIHWSEKENVLWKSPIPGRGHGSPVVSGNQVFVAAAEPDSETQSVLCFERQTGKLKWQTRIHQGGFEKKGNAKSTLASSTPACDGERVFINFLHAGAVYATALNYQGTPLWQTKVSDYVLHQGYGSSPAIYKSLVIVAVDTKGGGALAGLDRATGSIQWTKKRPALPNYASPIILEAAGREQLLLPGCDLVSSFDPLSGNKLWEIDGATTECVTSMPRATSDRVADCSRQRHGDRLPGCHAVHLDRRHPDGDRRRRRLSARVRGRGLSGRTIAASSATRSPPRSPTRSAQCTCKETFRWHRPRRFGAPRMPASVRPVPERHVAEVVTDPLHQRKFVRRDSPALTRAEHQPITAARIDGLARDRNRTPCSHSLPLARRARYGQRRSGPRCSLIREPVVSVEVRPFRVFDAREAHRASCERTSSALP